MTTRVLMSPEDLDEAAVGGGGRRRADIAEAIAECYLPVRRAGYSPEQARLMAAGWLAKTCGLLVVEECAPALLMAAEVAEVAEA